MFHRRLPHLPRNTEPGKDIKEEHSKSSDDEVMDFQTFTTELLNLDESPEETDNK